ncbi:hypothetical protein N7475_000637 [Penicillium sp. IBT 31633x]|nr:hypothetical protein N7475_000637 [Penicillium sp. IBT 31633x]
MYAIKQWLSVGCLLALQTCTTALNTSATSLEVDLVFPRNETYAPSAFMPIVFAIQNPQFSSLLELNVTYIISRPRDYIETSDPSIFKANSSTNFGSDYRFLYNTTDYVNSEGQWELTWSADYSRCNSNDTDETIIMGNSTINSIIFTTKNGSSKLDLVAASKDDTCATAVAAWDVSEVITPDWSTEECAVAGIGEEWAPVDPCALKFDSAVASNISDALAARACAASNSSESCQAAKEGEKDGDKEAGEEADEDGEKGGEENAAGALNLPGGVAVTAIFAGLAYILA